MVGAASVQPPCSAPFVKPCSWEKDESISFKGEERISLSQILLLNTVKHVWNGNQGCGTKVSGTFRPSDYLEG